MLKVIDWSHARIQREGETGGPDLPQHGNNIGFLSIIDPDPLKSQSYQACIQYWAIIKMAFRWLTDDDLL